ncbi:hypothetical protein HDU92_007413 [Lobulomyces angularis]|nr:hypothetical protein HDU92_007413 [Lobulomyces angularis]
MDSQWKKINEITIGMCIAPFTPEERYYSHSDKISLERFSLPADNNLHNIPTESYSSNGDANINTHSLERDRMSLNSNTTKTDSNRFSITQYGKVQITEMPFVSLQVGDYVQILETYGSWVRGYVLSDYTIKVGIFPNLNIATLDRKKNEVLNSPFLKNLNQKGHIVNAGKLVKMIRMDSRRSSVVAPRISQELKKLIVPLLPPHNTINGQKDPLIDEISSVLREWGYTLKFHLSQQNYELYSTVNKFFGMLFKGRRQLLNKTLSEEELSKLRKDLIILIEHGNHLQGIDLIVRHHEKGYLLTQYNISIIKLARIYTQKAFFYSDITGNSSLFMDLNFLQNWQYDFTTSHVLELPKNKVSHLYFELKACVASVCLPVEYAELNFALYNKIENRFVSENFVIHLNSMGFPINQSPEAECSKNLFTNISSKEMNENLILLCRIIRVGKMTSSDRDSFSKKPERTLSTQFSHFQNNFSDFTSSLSAKSSLNSLIPSTPSLNSSTTSLVSNGFVRRPFGVALFDIGSLVASNNSTYNSVTSFLSFSTSSGDVNSSIFDSVLEFPMKIYLPVVENNFYNLHEHILNRNTKEYDDKNTKAEQLIINLRLFSGVYSPETIIKQFPGLLQNIQVTPRQGFLDFVSPGVNKNSLYVTICEGDFSQGKKSSAKNVEVSIQLRLNSGEIIEDCIHKGVGESLSSSYESIVFYHNSNPKWYETIKVDFESTIFELSHIFITYKHISASSRKGEDCCFAFSYIPLLQTSGTAINDGNHTLLVYRYDSKIVGNPANYLNQDTKSGDKPVSYPKDSMVIRTLLNSTTRTQNHSLFHLLSWKESKREFVASSENITIMKETLKGLLVLGEMEITKFLPDLLIALFTTLHGTTGSLNSANGLVTPRVGPLDSDILNSLIFILSIIQDARYFNQRAVFEEFLNTTLPKLCPFTWWNLTVAFQNLIDDGINETSGDRSKALRNGLKVCKGLIECGLKTWSVNGEECLSKGIMGFPALLSGIFQSLNTLMTLKMPTHILATQTLALKSFPSLISCVKVIIPPEDLINVILMFIASCRGEAIKLNGHKLLFIGSIIQMLIEKNASENEKFFRIKVIESATQLLLEWAEGEWDKLAEANNSSPNSMARTSASNFSDFLRSYNPQEDMPSIPSRLSPTKAFYLPERENFRLWLFVAGELVDKVSKIFEVESNASDENVEYMIRQISKLLPRLLIMYSEIIDGNVDFVRKNENDELGSTLGSFKHTAKIKSQNDQYLPNSTELADLSATIISLFYFMPTSFLYSFLKDGGSGISLSQHTNLQLLPDLFTCLQSLLHGDGTPATWPVSQMLVHRICLKTLGPVGELLISELTAISASESQPHLNQQHIVHLAGDFTSYFATLLQLLNSRWVQIEQFGPQHSRLAYEVGADVREEGGRLLEQMWVSLKQVQNLKSHRSSGSQENLTSEAFISFYTQHLIGSFLELTLSPNTGLKFIAVNLLFSAIEREFTIVKNLRRVEAECIDRLERLFIGEGKGDEEYRIWIFDRLKSKFEEWKVDEASVLGEDPSADNLSIIDGYVKTENETKFPFVAMGMSALKSINDFLEICLLVRSLDFYSPVQTSSGMSHHPSVINYANRSDDFVAAILRLMRFVKVIGHRGIYVKYAHKLAQIHSLNHHHVEAAMALKLHADVLDWSNDITVEALPEYDFPNPETAFSRKSKILFQVVALLEKGKAWERAIEILSELAPYYESGPNLDYGKVGEIYSKKAYFFQLIWGTSDTREERYPPTYFRVHFHGFGWNYELQGKQFVYKTGEWERLVSFIEHILTDYPEATLVRNNGAVGPEITNSKGLYLQITSLKPEMDVRNRLTANGFAGFPLKWEETTVISELENHTPIALYLLEPDLDPDPDGLGTKVNSVVEKIPESVRSYYAANEVNIFTYSRPFRKPVSENLNASEDEQEKQKQQKDDPAKEFLELWTEKIVVITTDTFPGLSCRSEVKKTIIFEISPIENAILAVKAKTRQLILLEKKYRPYLKLDKTGLNINPFTMSLNGAVDAPVNGGIPMYRASFLTGEKNAFALVLENLIEEQVEIIHRSLLLHDRIVSVEMRPLHDSLNALFRKNFFNELKEIHRKKSLKSKYQQQLLSTRNASKENSRKDVVSVCSNEIGKINRSLNSLQLNSSIQMRPPSLSSPSSFTNSNLIAQPILAAQSIRSSVVSKESSQ